MSKEIYIPNKLKKVSRATLAVAFLAGGTACEPSRELTQESVPSSSVAPETNAPTNPDFFADLNLIVPNPCVLVGKGEIETEGFIEGVTEVSSMSSESGIERTIYYNLHPTDNPNSRFLIMQDVNPDLAPDEPAPNFEGKVKVTGEMIKDSVGGSQCLLEVTKIQQ